MKALIIDDDPIFNYLMSRRLNKLGLSTVIVQTIPTALLALKAQSIQVIMLDLVLESSLGGFEFLQLRFSDPVLRKIPVIVMSGNYDLKTIEKCFMDRSDAFLMKPVQESLLCKHLYKLGILKEESLN